MKSESEIKQCVKRLLSTELDRRVAEATTRLPHMCVHNHRQALDVRKRVADEPNANYNRVSLPAAPVIGLCMLGAETPEEWQGNICEDPIDAERCPFFTPKLNRSEIWSKFREEVSDAEWLKGHLPEVYALCWVLGGFDQSLPWWKKLWFKLVRLEVPPVKPSVDPVALLPESR